MKKLLYSMTLLAGLAVTPLDAAFQDMSLGARPQGMGGAFTAIADDANGVFWNPAGLTSLKRQDVSFMHGLLQDVSGLNIDYLAYALPMKNGAFGLGGLRLGASLEQGANGNTSGISENTFFITGALKTSILSPNDFSIGINIKRLSISTGLEDGAGMAFDAGMLFKAHQHLYIGAVARNVVADIKDESLPVYFKLGLGVPLLDNRIRFAADFDSKENIDGSNGLSVRYHVGAEVRPIPVLAIRGGYDDGDLTVGGGVSYNSWNVDYAYRVSDVFGAVHRMSLGISFGPLVSGESHPRRKIRKKKKVKHVKKKKVSVEEKELKDLGVQVTKGKGDSVKVILSGANALKFPTGSAKLDGRALSALKGIAGIIQKYPSRKLKIAGYSDNRGSSKVNTELSGYRAEVVRRALVQYGVDQDNIISVKGMGPVEPVSDNFTEEGRQKNRRVELSFE